MFSPNIVPVRFAGNLTRDYSELLAPSPLSPTDRGTQDYVQLPSRVKPDVFLLRTLLKYVPRGKPILEIGFNRGNNLAPLSQFFSMHGIEIQSGLLEEALQYARKLFGSAHNLKATTWDFAEDGTLPPEWASLKGKLNAIYAVHMVTHLSSERMQSAFQKLCEDYLAPGGVVILTNTEPLPEHANHRKPKYNRGTYPHTEAEILASFPGFKLLAKQKYQNKDGHFEKVIADRKQLASVLDRTYWMVLQKPGPMAQRIFYRHCVAPMVSWGSQLKGWFNPKRPPVLS